MSHVCIPAVGLCVVPQGNAAAQGCIASGLLQHFRLAHDRREQWQHCLVVLHRDYQLPLAVMLCWAPQRWAAHVCCSSVLK